MQSKMTDASKRTVQQQRIQQLQERLELYNAAATRADPTIGVSASSSANASIAGATAASKPLATKPTRAAPAVTSPDPTSQAATTASMEEVAPRSSPTTTSAARRDTAQSTNGGATMPTAAEAKAATERVRVSPQPQTQHVTPPAPAPAPRLARNLAQEFVGSAGNSPLSQPRMNAKSSATFTVFGRASAAPSPMSTDTPAANASSTHLGAGAAAAASGSGDHEGTSPLRASDVFGYYDGSDDDTEYVEYEVEEVEEYEEDEEDYSDEEEDDPVNAEPAPTLDNVLRRIFRAYSGSPERPGGEAGLEQSSGAAAAASASSPPPASSGYVPAFASSSAVHLAAAASAGAAASNSTHPLIQRAAELYRQHRLHQAQQQQQQEEERRRKARNSHHSPFHTGGSGAAEDSFSIDRDDGSTATTSLTTSEPSEDLHHDDDDDSETEASTSSESYMSPAAAYAALQNGGTLPLVARKTASAAGAGSPATPVPSPSAATTTANNGSAAGAASLTRSPSSSSFDQLETAYRQLLLLQRGVEYAVDRAGMQHFPASLPLREKAHGLAQARDALVQKDAAMRAAPPEGASLEDMRQHEASALETTVAAVTAKLDAAIKGLKAVTDRSSIVEGKLRLLKQREMDLAKQREARLIVEREVVTKEQRLSERSDKLKKRETDYNSSLQQHDEQQRSAQEQIGEVEQLSKQVSSWLAILEERDRRLAEKEKRLQRVQSDLMQRSEDVSVWKKATARVKQIPPPPSPPRIS